MNAETIEVTWQRQDGVTFANPTGRIDSTNASELQTALESGIEAGDREVVLDFEQVTFISSAGLRVIITFAKQLRNNNAKLALCSFKAAVKRVVTISGFDQVLGVYASRANAINSFKD